MMNEVLPGQLLTNLNSLHMFSYEKQLASMQERNSKIQSGGGRNLVHLVGFTCYLIMHQ